MSMLLNNFQICNQCQHLKPEKASNLNKYLVIFTRGQA
jgi:hypothetical protein